MPSSSEDQRALHESIKPYHVLINHRGPDTKDNLASVIYHAFSRSGLNVFFDKTEFVAGQEIPSTIKEAISSSSVQIAILSPRYAESHWCLDELRLMQRTGAKIIPVYYGVSRKDLLRLRKGQGAYAVAFEKLDKKMDDKIKRNNSDTIKKWKEAVHKVCDIPGLELKSKRFKGDLGKLVDVIYSQVMEHLRSVTGDDLLGLDKAGDEFKDFFEPSEMASSSEDQNTLCGPIHAFINGGSDTKKTLVSIIYHELSRSGLNVFFNKEEFKAQEELPGDVTKAIPNSLVRIAILSPKYAKSHWCLEELRLMQQTAGTIIPVFYDVPTRDLQKLRNGEGKYAEAFSTLDIEVYSNNGIYNRDRIKEWKEAIYQVNNISGTDLSLNGFSGDWGRLVHVIYKRVREHLRRVWKKSVDGLIGLDKAVNDLQKFFLEDNREQTKKNKIVGIVGTPGSGKTTLAEEFYYRYRRFFDRSSLLLGVRKASKQNVLPTLQSQLLKDLTNDSLAISNVSEGKDILADRVRRLCHTKSLKFLIVIDDVSSQDQLEALLRKEDILRPGSLVVVTSRNNAVLKLSGISLCYEAKPLSPPEAKELLWRSAFHKPERIEEFDSLVETVLSKCGGFPKLLKCLGENLRLYGNNEKEDWEDVLQMPIADIFKAIWGDLEEDERQIFLDIACFFHKIDKNSAIRAWAGSGWRRGRAFQKLEYMCLVHVDDTNCLSMPDYLRDLGQEIADQQLRKALDLPCHLWHRNAARSFRKEPPLQEGAKLRGTREASHNKLSERTTEELFKVQLLHVPVELREIRVIQCSELVRIPPTIRLLNHLETMTLDGTSVESLPHEFCKLQALKHLVLQQCDSLKSLPHEFWELQALKHLVLQRCDSLKSLPRKFFQLQALKHSVLKQCKSLKSLPKAFGKLTNLQYIELSYCEELSSLPPSFCELTQLKTLDLKDCRILKIKANRFEKITSIEELTMENCKNLKMLPTQTTSQGLMTKLNLLGTNLKKLPEDINKLKSWQQINIGSPFLKSLPSSLEELTSLMKLELHNCSLETYPDNIGSLSLSERPQSENIYVYRRPCIRR